MRMPLFETGRAKTPLRQWDRPLSFSLFETREALGRPRLPAGMPRTESGTYRVYESDHGDDEWLLVETGGEEPIYVRAEGYDDPLQSAVDDLEPGYLVAATLDWGDDDGPAFADLAVETRTLFEFVDGTPDIFDQAERTFEEARREHTPVASNVTYDTDGQANGVVYTVAKQRGEQDVFEGFRTGRMTLEPMIDKLGDGDAEPPYEVFVIRPEREPFVVVYLTLEKGGLLPNTLRDEYDCPRPETERREDA